MERLLTCSPPAPPKCHLHFELPTTFWLMQNTTGTPKTPFSQSSRTVTVGSETEIGLRCGRTWGEVFALCAPGVLLLYQVSRL